VAAIVIFIQHYVTTFREERRYIWNAPPSFAKYSFIISRHIPIICAVLAFVSLSGFLGYKISDKVRRAICLASKLVFDETCE
jgi:hypothetical protein